MAHVITMTQNIAAVVFDLDGLIFNTEELYEDVGAEVLRRRGKEFTGELMDQMMGRQASEALRLMIDWHQLEDTVDELAAESAAIFDQFLDERLAPMSGLMELLVALEEIKIPKAIATSSGRPFASRVLGTFDLEGRFEFVLTAEDIARGKPAPDIYLRASQKLERPPSQIMVLEDSHNGCRAAAAAGAYVVAVPSGRSMTHDFSCAHLVANTLADPRIYRVLGIAGDNDE